MSSIEATFIAIGTSPTILQLAEQLTGELQQRRAVGDTIKSSGMSAETNSFIMKLPLPDAEDHLVLAEAERWLDRHATVLKNADGRKKIEFETYLGTNDGCRILTIPHSIVSLCASLGLDIANQAIREYTKEECDQMRRDRK